jgi:hypothetical protein
MCITTELLCLLTLHILKMLKLLTHSCSSPLRILQRMRYKLIAKQLINLLQSLAFSFWEQEKVAGSRNNIERKEEVTELKSNI